MRLLTGYQRPTVTSRYAAGVTVVDPHARIIFFTLLPRDILISRSLPSKLLMASSLNNNISLRPRGPFGFAQYDLVFLHVATERQNAEPSPSQLILQDTRPSNTDKQAIA